MSGLNKNITSIAIFASGAGSNAAKILAEMTLAKETGTQNFAVDLIVCNKPGAGVLNIAAQYNINTLLIEKDHFFAGNGYVADLQAAGIQFIVLAGFLWKLPVSIIKAFPGKIINIHPALLPKYGGKGMYGAKVHQAIIEAGEKESGITIHYVDELYDHGNIIFQATCAIAANDTAASLAQKIHLLEHQHYAATIYNLLENAK